jgi:hypothetical protein
MKQGDQVAWQWGNGLAEGKIKSVHFETTTITSKGKSITRHGSNDDPALIIEHKSGNDVVKLAHEVQQTEKL